MPQESMKLSIGLGRLGDTLVVRWDASGQFFLEIGNEGAYRYLQVSVPLTEQEVSLAALVFAQVHLDYLLSKSSLGQPPIEGAT